MSLIKHGVSASPFKDNVLDGRSALITGGGSGIGFAIAFELARHGAFVTLAGRREQFLMDAVDKLTKDGYRATYCVGDVRKPEDCQRFVAKAVATFGHIDTVVNSAAGNFLAVPEDLSGAAFKNILDIDAVGVFNVSTAAFQELRSAGARGVVSPGSQGCGGTPVIINISATLQYGATWYQTHASAAKAAIDSVTRSLALEWGHLQIRCVGIAPGPIRDTPGMAKLSGGASGDELDEMVATSIPLARCGTPQEIARTAVFLCTPSADYITGDTVVVDGGAWLWKPPIVPRESVSRLSRGVEGSSRASDTLVSILSYCEQLSCRVSQLLFWSSKCLDVLFHRSMKPKL